MPTFKLHFTQEAISKIILPETKEDFYNDTKEKGLFLIARKSKVFYLRKTIEKKGRSRTIKLGTFPYISVVEARAKASELKNQISKCIINPLEKLPIANNQIDNKLTTLTFKEFFDKYIEEHSKLKNRSWKNNIAIMELYGQNFYKRKISAITRDDIQKKFNEISNKFKFSANNFLKLLSAMFNRGIKWEMLEKNPAKGIEKHPENVRERYIASQEELSKFIKIVIAKCTKIMADVFLMILFTGARKSNVLSMKWQDINFENATWSIPAKSAKNAKTQRVHLVKYALNILTRREKENNNKSVWVFPSDTSKSGHIEEPKSAWKRICKLAGISDLRIHDLRRTHGSWMRKVGADREIIGEALGHKDRRSTERYDIIETSQTVKYREQAIKKLMPELNTVTSQTEIKKITDNTELNNIIESLQSQIKAQQKMIEELMKQIRN